jgi:hypothetical protein
MLWTEDSVRRAKTFAMSAALLLALETLQGCIQVKPGLIPDNQITAEEFDDTIAFEPADDAEEARPPLEVHQVDESQVTAAGGKKVVDGSNWLNASDVERNDILNLVEEVQPEDSILVIVVATGDIWQIPLAAGQLLPDGVQPWTGDEYDEMDEYYEGPRIQTGQLTLQQYLTVAAVANSDTFGRIFYTHAFGATGYQEIKSWQGFRGALARTWLRETPVQRYLRLVMLSDYFGRLPQFQGAGNQIAFGVVVPEGGLYAMPLGAYQEMIARRALLVWTSYELLGLPVTQLLLDRAIKNTRIVIDRVEEP